VKVIFITVLALLGVMVSEAAEKLSHTNLLLHRGGRRDQNSALHE